MVPARETDEEEIRMLEGLVQHDYPLTLQHVLRRMRTVNGEREVVTLLDAAGRPSGRRTPRSPSARTASPRR